MWDVMLRAGTGKGERVVAEPTSQQVMWSWTGISGMDYGDVLLTEGCGSP